LASSWVCLKFISCAFNCFIKSLKPSRMRLGRFLAYPLSELFKIWWANQRGSFFSCYHIGVCAILEVTQVNESFMLGLRGLWRVINLFFKWSPFMLHILLVPITFWTFFWPFVFANVWFWVELKNIITLLKLFNPWWQLFFQRTLLQLCVSCTPFH
jgi:hypothetical protein